VGGAKNIVAHQPLADRVPAKPRFDFGPEIFVACPHEPSFSGQLHSTDIWQVARHSEKNPESESKNVAVQATGDVRPRGGNTRRDNDLPAWAGSPKITILEFFSVAV
jgi:hypothetical protein